MHRVRVLWLFLLLVACREKAPLDGAIRVSAKYGSYKPACVRVSARDAQGHEGSTDILASQFQNTATQEILVAVFRKPEWEHQLTLEVASYDGSEGEACSGTLVEKHSTPEPITVPLGDYARFDITLRAQDFDGDTFIHPEEGVTGTDCDDKLIEAYPGAPEKCVVGVDFDCDGDQACQDSQCVDNTCDDGNACTKGDRCQGSGASAVCEGQTVQCQQPTSVCFERAECAPATGECVNIKAPPETVCNDNNPCTLNDQCGPEAQCAGTNKACNAPPTVCSESLGTCNVATGNCDYELKPASASCNDGVACTVSDQCDGAGMCRGTDTPCMPSSVCHRVTGGCVATDTCTEEPDPAKVNTVCNFPAGGAGVCRVSDGECSSFPYVPRNFEPDEIAVASIGALSTTCAVTFDSTTLTWSPSSCVSNPPQPLELTQGNGMVLFPLSSLTLGGDLRLLGNRPVILAVYADVTLNHSILANGATNATELSTTPGAGGNHQSCSGRQGGNGILANVTGGGGGGAGGRSAGGTGNRGNDAGATGGDAGAELAGSFVPLVGGCPGGSGGGASSVAGKGGAGGGAVQLSVAGTLTLNAWITTSGGGGLGGRFDTNQGTGGGGGGGGGAALLEAHRLVLGPAARVTANGGGGGEGADYHATGSVNGKSGEDGPRSSEDQAAGGRGNTGLGGDGGNGGSASGTPGNGTAGDSFLGVKGSGGGGGGAAGYIRLRSVQPCSLDASSVISPAINRECPL